jgi:spoIIIJ-associated protein
MEILKQTKTLCEELLTKLKFTAEVNCEFKSGDNERNYIFIEITGEDLSELIGYHGKVLESLQIIMNLLLTNELRAENLSIIIDINNYRIDRIEYIRSVAKRAIAEVKEAKQSLELAPMKPYERRIVHMVVKEDTGVVSESIGDGDERRVVIKSQD